MVKVREDHASTVDGEINIEIWLARIAEVTGRLPLNALKAAIDLALEYGTGKLLATGISCFEQGLVMVETLAELIPDEESLAAAMIYNTAKNECVSIETVSERLSPKIADLIKATKQLGALQSVQQEYNFDYEDSERVEKLRKMLLTLEADIRCILIKLAERTCTLRYAESLSADEQKRIADETIAIHAPLANRLGIGHIKWKLEDLAFRYSEPDNYKNIARQLADKRLKREEYIEGVIATLNKAIAKEEVGGFEVSGRVKHIFSIWRKMQSKEISFEKIYDAQAVRVMVDEVSDCYAVLDVVHSLWNHIPKEFDDYIASPKQNGYQSLHTAVVGPEGELLEIQIRTREMHEKSELGAAAHWRYKEDKHKQPDSFLEERIAWLRRLIECQKNVSDDEFVEKVRSEFLQDRVYVFTPKGEVLDLPMGATPLDFAYSIHSEVGHRCRGARVNGRMVPLTYTLKTGEQVEIITAKEARPSRNWMIRHHGYTHTSKARAHIQRWFKHRDFDKNLHKGKSLLDRELKRIKIKADYAAVAERFRFKDQNRFLASLGAGDLSLIQVLNIAQSLAQVNESSQVELPVIPEKQFTKKRSDDIRIYGADDLLTMIAGCCKPIPREPIIGYITQGRGVSIHRRNCANVIALEKSNPERVIDANWGDDAQENYPVDICVKAYERNDLVNDINRELGNESVRLLGMTINADPNDQTVDLSMAVEISNLNSLSRLLSKIGQIKNVIYAIRQ